MKVAKSIFSGLAVSYLIFSLEADERNAALDQVHENARIQGGVFRNSASTDRRNVPVVTNDRRLALPRPSIGNPGVSNLASTLSLPNHGVEFGAGELLIKLRKGSASLRAMAQASSNAVFEPAVLGAESSLGQVLVSHSAKEIRPAFRTAASRRIATTLPRVSAPDESRDVLVRWYHVGFPTNADINQITTILRAEPEVEAVEPNFFFRLADETTGVISGLPDATTDPDMGKQWYHSAIRDQAAWNYLKQNGQYPGGSRDVVVAVIDTGVDFNHEELVGNIWTNSREIPANGVDDDHNGFADDVHGCSVVSDSRSHSGDCMDYHGHGTHVAGIIAATAFNLKGGVGVAFNVQIMAVRAAQYSGTLTATDVSEGILYAIDNGAEVINMSFGGYNRSQIMEDALAFALNKAVLVSAAGNDGLPAWKYPFYPAALPYVLGVMALTPPPMGLTWFSNFGYAMAAPGEGIYSALPGNQYAAWSGTSMAAPVVSGIGALMRSFYWQRDIYSSRFLMGALFASGLDPAGYIGPVDAYRAVSELPVPGVTLFNNWLFDNATIASQNNGNGRIDSGETVDLAVEVINRAGMATNVLATLRAHADGAVSDDPYVTILTNQVSYGVIGPWNRADNGFIYDTNGIISGVSRPFVVHVDQNCPNDHIIPFELTITFQDGWNTNHTSYTRIDRYYLPVQRGKSVPTVVSTNLTLTADQYWIVGGPVLIEGGATLTIAPGTQVQWGAVSGDPYNPGPQTGSMTVRGALQVQGSASQPVALFPSYVVSGQTVKITVEQGGLCDMQYVKIQNPWLEGVRSVDHGDLFWDAYPSRIDVQLASNSIFSKFRGSGEMYLGRCENCLFDANWLPPLGSLITDQWGSRPALDGVVRYNCVFLQDNENNKPLVVTAPLSFRNPMTNDKGDLPLWSSPLFTNNATYVVLPMEHVSLRLAEAIARFYGGHVTSVSNQAESEFLKSYLPKAAHFRPNDWYYTEEVYVGLTDQNNPNTFSWLDGSPMNFNDWAHGFPAELSPASEHVVQFMYFICNICSGGTPGYRWGWQNVEQAAGPYRSFVLRLPGNWTLDTLNPATTNGQLLSFVRDNFEPHWKHNAFLPRQQNLWVDSGSGSRPRL